MAIGINIAAPIAVQAPAPNPGKVAPAQAPAVAPAHAPVSAKAPSVKN